MTAPPRIVAIETSGGCGSVAVGAGESLLHESLLSSTARHAADLLPAVDSAVRRVGWTPREIEHCYVSTGPGSFTGLRIAVTFARHLALSTGCVIVAVPSLDIVAEEARRGLQRGDHVAVVLDAKRGQVFGAVYRNDGESMTRLQGPDQFDPAALLAGAPRPCVVTGEGIAYHQAVIDASRLAALPLERRWPRARSVHRLGWHAARRGQFTPPGELVPTYIRGPEAEEVRAKKLQSAAESGVLPHSAPSSSSACKPSP